MPKPTVLYSIVADTVRREVGSKLAFLGVYAGTIILESPFPARLEGLAFVNTFQLHVPSSRVQYRIELPGRAAEEFEGDPLKQDRPSSSTTSVIQIPNLELQQKGIIRLTMTFEDGFVHVLEVRVMSKSDFEAEQWPT